MRRASAVLFLAYFIFAGRAGAQVCGTDEANRYIRKQHPEWGQRPGGTLKTEFEIDSAGLLVIPIVFHITYKLIEYEIPDTQIQNQVQILNETYGRYASGANTGPLGANSGIRFCLATRDPDGRPTRGITRTQYSQTQNYRYPEDEMYLKDTLSPGWDPRYYLNVWLVTNIYSGADALEGYAYYPYDAAITALDGLVLQHSKIGNGGVGTAEWVSRGRTLTHEIGHYLGLFHPWGDEPDCSGTDQVDDTPPCAGTYFKCIPLMQCDSLYRQIENYMDYTPDTCQNLFTIGQIKKMRSTIMAYRPELVSVDNLGRTGCEALLDSFVTRGEFLIWPNPAKQGTILFSIQFADSLPTDISVYDEFGRYVTPAMTTSYDRGTIAFDFRGFRSGLYLFKILHGGKEWVRRVLIENE